MLRTLFTKPNSTEVVLWSADVRTLPLDPLTLLLASDEHDRAARFAFARDAERYIVARGLLRVILGHCLEADPAEIRLIYGVQGKPELAQGDLSFNLSHAGDRVLIAVTIGRRVGIDLELIRPVSDMQALVDSLFSPTERAQFARVPADQQVRAFFNGWTRKEAVIKALGTGLSLPLTAFDVTLDDNPQLARVPGDWSLHSFTLAPDYAAALAVEGQTVVRWQEVNFPLFPADAL